MSADASNRPMVELRGVCHSYPEAGGRHEVLRGLDLTVPTGEMLALLGRSGSGKSTILNLISGIDLPQTGEIAVAQRTVNRLSERDRTLLRRELMGFVFQFFNLLPTLTVLENLWLPLQLNGWRRREAGPRARAMLAAVGLADFADRFPDTLSGGEQQRVALARALVHEPRLILADEPTGNLDADTGAQVFSLLETLVREEGRTLILVTHSTELAARADRVLRLHRGQLHAAGAAQ